MATSKRELIAPRGDKRFIRRDAQGRITESDDVGRSLGQDRKRRAKNASTPGLGDKGDRKPATRSTTRKSPMKQASTRASANGKKARKTSSGARKSTVRKADAGTSRSSASKRSASRSTGASANRATASKRSASASTGASASRATASKRSTSAKATRKGAGTQARAPNAIQLLKSDHVTVRELLTRLEETTSRGTKVREELLARLRREIDVHTTIEEEIFYPAFKAAGKRADDDKLYFEALEEHRAAGDLVLPDLLSTDPSSECFGGRAKVLKELIEHHAKEEEREMFPRARELMSTEQLHALGAQMFARKQALMAQPAPPKSIAGRVLSAVVGAITPDALVPDEGARLAKSSRNGAGKNANGAGSRSSA